MKSTIIERNPHALKIQFQLGAEDLGPAPAMSDKAWVSERMRQSVKTFIQEQKQRPCKEPVLKLLAQTASSLSFVCNLEVFPPVKLPASLQATVDVPALQAPSEAELSAAVEALQLRWADLRPVERPAQWGDLLIVDLVGTCNKQLIPLSPQHKWQMLLKPAEAGQEPDPMLAQIVGIQAGEQKTLMHMLPEDYPYPAWRKAPAQYQIYLHQLNEVRVPPQDDVLAQVSGLAENFDALLEVLYQQTLEQKRQAWLARVREAVSAQVVKASQVQIPAEWEVAELRSGWDNGDALVLAQLSHFAQAPALLAQGWQSWQSHVHLRRQQAEALKTRLVLQEIALRQGLSLSPQQRETALHALAESLSITDQELDASLDQGRSRVTIEGQLLLDKVVRWLVGQAKVSSEGKALN